MTARNRNGRLRIPEEFQVSNLIPKNDAAKIQHLLLERRRFWDSLLPLSALQAHLPGLKMLTLRARPMWMRAGKKEDQTGPYAHPSVAILPNSGVDFLWQAKLRSCIYLKDVRDSALLYFGDLHERSFRLKITCWVQLFSNACEDLAFNHGRPFHGWCCVGRHSKYYCENTDLARKPH